MPPLLLPANHHQRSVLDELTDTIYRAQALYGSVCFWSIAPSVVPGLATLLNMPGSFCIADIHLPTRIDNLNLFHIQGANLHLYFKELRPHRPDAYLQRHLLHTKMLLFDLPHGQAELWVGSHNFTKQALKGINREASLVIPCQQGDALYIKTREYLKSILDDPDCHGFNPALIDTYKRLQGLPPDETEGGVYVLPVSWRPSEVADLTQQVILLAGDDPREAAQFAALSSTLSNERAQLAIQAYDLDGGPVRKFTAELHNQGTISPTDSATYDIAFGERRLAARLGTSLPLISARSEEHTAEVLRRFRYWVSIRIGDELPPEIQFEEDRRPTSAEWKTDKKTTHFLFQVLEKEPEEAEYYPYSDGPRQSSKVYSSSSIIRSELVEQSESAVARVTRWMARAQQRRSRSVPAEPTAVHAVFQTQQSVLTEGLASLDAQFSPSNLPALRELYELPLLAATYSNQTPSPIGFNMNEAPQVKKLLKRHVLR